MVLKMLILKGVGKNTNDETSIVQPFVKSLSLQEEEWVLMVFYLREYLKRSLILTKLENFELLEIFMTITT